MAKFFNIKLSFADLKVNFSNSNLRKIFVVNVMAWKNLIMTRWRIISENNKFFKPRPKFNPNFLNFKLMIS